MMSMSDYADREALRMDAFETERMFAAQAEQEAYERWADEQDGDTSMEAWADSLVAEAEQAIDEAMDAGVWGVRR